MKPPIEKILFITLTNIGDVILTTPVLSILRANLPCASITVLTGPPGYELFDGSRMVDDVILYDKRVTWWEKLVLIHELKQSQFDLVVDLRNTAIPFFLNPPFRTPLVPWGRGRIVSKRNQHLKRLRPLAEALGIDLRCATPFDFYGWRDVSSIEAKLAGKGVSGTDSVVCLAPGAKSELKRWTLRGFAEVGENLSRDLGKTVVLIGDERDRSLADVIARLSANRLINLCGETSLRELAALIARSELVVTNDSAPMHLAYELGAPVVAIFGPTDEKKYGREDTKGRIVTANLPCRPCEKARCQIEETKACLTRVEGRKVYERCLELLTSASTYPHVSIESPAS